MALNSHIPNAPWLRATPLDWQIDRLKDIVPRILGGGTPPSSDPDCWEDGDIVWVTPTDFSRSEGSTEISDSERKITRTGLTSSAATLLPKGTVIMASRATIGTVRIAGTELTTNQGFISFICDERKLHRRFLYYVISGILGEYFAEIAPGTTFCEISRGKAKLEPISYPPLPEQERIATYLDASCAAIDAAVAAKRRQLETLDDLRSTLVYEAVTRGINRSALTVVQDIPSYDLTPNHWKRTKLRYEISIQNGDFASDKLQDDGANPILGGNGVMGYTDLSNVDGETVVIGRVGAYCGNAHYVQGKAWVSDNALIVKSHHHARFLCHLFNALNFNAQASNTAQPVITGTKIKNTYVVLPSPVEQEAICTYLDEKLTEMKHIAAVIEAQIATLTAYCKSLIHECVTGQRRVTEGDLNRVAGHEGKRQGISL